MAENRNEQYFVGYPATRPLCVDCGSQVFPFFAENDEPPIFDKKDRCGRCYRLEQLNRSQINKPGLIERIRRIFHI